MLFICETAAIDAPPAMSSAGAYLRVVQEVVA
jgi:hypothetical protein